MTHRGRPVRTETIRRTALLTVEGERDDISGVGQTKAAHALATNLAHDKKQHFLADGRRPLRRLQRLALPLARSSRASTISSASTGNGHRGAGTTLKALGASVLAAKAVKVAKGRDR